MYIPCLEFVVSKKQWHSLTRGWRNSNSCYLWNRKLGVMRNLRKMTWKLRCCFWVGDEWNPVEWVECVGFIGVWQIICILPQKLTCPPKGAISKVKYIIFQPLFLRRHVSFRGSAYKCDSTFSSFLEDMLNIIKSNFSAGSKEACETRWRGEILVREYCFECGQQKVTRNHSPF